MNVFKTLSLIAATGQGPRPRFPDKVRNWISAVSPTSVNNSPAANPSGQGSHHLSSLNSGDRQA